MKLKYPVNSKDHYQGNENAVIELVEFGDYQCPHCGQAYPIIQSIQKKLGTKLKFVFRNFPLQEIHPNAINAAIATEAAALQGKFWEMHDIIFENQKEIETDDLINYAKSIDLDTKQFENDFGKLELLDKVANDFEGGVRSGVNGTPSFFVNGQKYEGNWDEASFLEFLKTL